MDRRDGKLRSDVAALSAAAVALHVIQKRCSEREHRRKRRRMTEARASAAAAAVEADDEVNQEVLRIDNNSVPNSRSPCLPRRMTVGLPRALPNRSHSQETITTRKSLCSPVIDVDENSWQAGYRSLRERNAVMLNNDLMADVHFKVGHTPNVMRVAAHRYVLSIGSSVFFAMFYGPLAANKTNAKEEEDIEIPDVEPTAFLNLLRYLYCDRVDLEPDAVLSTLYAAKKYIVPHLACECVRYLETGLAADNACVLLAQANLFEESELMQRCWEVIDAQATEALRSDGFSQIDRATLELILSRDSLNVSEVVVFEATMEWAQAECVRHQFDVTPENRRKVLAEALFLIRITAMTVEEFADRVVPTGVLTLSEITDVFLHFTARNKPSLSFSFALRPGLQQRRCRRFRSSSYRGNQWRYRGRFDAIQFSCSRRIFIAGLGLYGSSNGAADYRVQIELKKAGGEVVSQTSTTFSSDGTNAAFPVLFSAGAVQIDPNTFYTVSVLLEGPELSYFGQEGNCEIHVGDVTFTFASSSESTNGTGVQGGQIPDFIFY